MADDIDPLKWSAQLRVAASSNSSKLVGDKITLPQNALEALLAAAPVVEVQNGSRNRHLTAGFDPFNSVSLAAERYAREQLSDRQQQLPHPLTFRIVNPQNGRAIYAGIREFSAEEGEVGLSTFLREGLGLQDASSPSKRSRSSTPGEDVEMANGNGHELATVTVHANQLPKGTYVRLRPLEAGYDPEDWKSLLERYLRSNFTTLTKGELLDVLGARHEHFRFLVDKFEPDVDGICIVDTDLEVDIEALNQEQAKETLQKRLAKNVKKKNTTEGSSSGGLVSAGEVKGQVVSGDYVDYELKLWDRNSPLDIDLQAEQDGSLLDLLVSPFSTHQRSRPRQDLFVFGDLEGRAAKRIRLTPTNAELDGAEALYISVHAWKSDEDQSESESLPTPYILQIKQHSTEAPPVAEITEQLADDEVVCKNCHQHIPKRTLALHEAFCYRNNVLCPRCSNVFLKSSEAWEKHWHCPHDDSHGNTSTSHDKHNSTFHPPLPPRCPDCDFEAFDIPILAQHRTSTCPAKEILCQFCHLVVPQQGPDDPSFTDPEVLLSGLTPHELSDGARTTECHICNRIVRLRDMKTHMRLHDRDRVTRQRPNLCLNLVCQRTLKDGDEARVIKEQHGLCNECFGPLYLANYDPEGKMLRRRVERRLLQQLIGGCGKPWCRNAEWCKTAHKNGTGNDRSMNAKDALVVIKPVLEQFAKGDPEGLKFCVDEGTQVRKRLAEMMAGEGEYELAWCLRALEEEKSDLNQAREWLSDRAPKIGEVVR